VHGEIDSSVEQRGVEFLREEPLSTGIGEMPVENTIPTCRERLDFKSRVMTRRREC
jgi:hypothetical protein